MHDLPLHVDLPPFELGFLADPAMEAALSYGGFLQRHPAMAALLHARRQEVRISAEDQLYFTDFTPQVCFVVVAEPASVNTAVVLPILARIAQMMVRGSLWVAEPESGLAMLKRLDPELGAGRALGSADLPLLVVLDVEGDFLAEWGPHPQAISPYLQWWLDENNAMESSSTEDVYLDLAGPCAAPAHRLLHEMRIWYNSGLSAACVAEVRAMLSAIGDPPDPEFIAEDGNAVDAGSHDEGDDFDGEDDGEYHEDDEYDEDDGDDDVTSERGGTRASGRSL